ncbi:hypothetical protein LINGRAHAP2_LOCUS29342 [Linum grandiflorum]
MEGVGSRIGRASSRYGPSATANVFNGPVRKWRKKWVYVPPPPTANQSSNSQSNGHRHGGGRSNNMSATTSNGNDNGCRLLLCRWTPLAGGGGGEGDGSSAVDEQPPKRRYRYTPIAALEERKKGAKSVDVEGKESDGNEVSKDGDDEDEPMKEEEDDEEEEEEEEAQETGGTLDLGLGLKGQSGQSKHKDEPPAEKANPGRVWAFG